jgi:hypothetical protein
MSWPSRPKRHSPARIFDNPVSGIEGRLPARHVRGWIEGILARDTKAEKGEIFVAPNSLAVKGLEHLPHMGCHRGLRPQPETFPEQGWPPRPFMRARSS